MHEFLLTKKITLIGTVRKNKPDIPNELKSTKYRKKHSLLFAFSNNITMVSYVPKKR